MIKLKAESNAAYVSKMTKKRAEFVKSPSVAEIQKLPKAEKEFNIIT